MGAARGALAERVRGSRGAPAERVAGGSAQTRHHERQKGVREGNKSTPFGAAIGSTNTAPSAEVRYAQGAQKNAQNMAPSAEVRCAQGTPKQLAKGGYKTPLFSP